MAEETSPMEVDQENQLAIVTVDQPSKTEEPRFYEGTAFGLPRGWTVEIRPRKASSKYHGKVDQFFYEPVTRRQFRSLKAVRKHLGIDVGQTTYKGKPKAPKVAGQSKNPNDNDKFESQATGQSEYVDEKCKDGSRNNKFAEEDKGEEDYHYFDKTAKRVRWQLKDGEQNSWYMYVKVPDSVQERWMDMFLKPGIYSNPPGM